MKKTLSLLAVTLISFSILGNTDKYRLILNDDPATTITVAWNQISGSNPVVYYGLTDHGTNYTSYTLSKTVDRSVNFRGMDNQFARLTGLIPDTIYYFVIHDSQGSSQRFWFRTVPNDLSRLSFIAGGDSRNNRTPRQNANELVSKLKPHAVFFGGDMTDDDNNSQWQAWLDDWQLTTSADGRMIPIVAARGNHEGSVSVYNLFDTPTSDSYYTITFGNDLIRAYTLNSEISVSGNQKTWLENDLNNHPQVRWKMAQYHKPMRPHTASKSEGNAEYAAWAQLFYDKGVRVVIDCDSHTAKTSWPVRPYNGPGSDEGFIQDNICGTVYAGEGCWGAPLRSNNDDKQWTRNSGSFNQFKLIFVDTAKIEMRTIKVDNASSVGSVSNNDPFSLPAGLDVWNPSNGAVVTILPASNFTKTDIEFAANTPTDYFTGNNLTLSIDVLSPIGGIDSIAFYIDGVLSSTDFTAPFDFTQNYANGQYIVEAIAVDTNGVIDNAQIIINVGSFSKTISLPIQGGDDDVEETQNGVIYNSSSDLEMVYDSYDFVSGTPNAFQTIGLRFQNVNVPKGAKIDSAYIQFRSDETDSDSAFYLITAEDADNSAVFEDSPNANVTARTKVPYSVSWTPPAWTSTGQSEAEQRTPQLDSLLQLVVNRPNWKQGNSVSFIIKGTGATLTDQNAKRVADSYEGNNPPVLVYTYSYEVKSNVSTEEPVKLEIAIYPNPLKKGQINIELPSNNPVFLEILDLSGKTVYRNTHHSENRIIRFDPHLAIAGVYILNVYSKDKRLLASKKFISE